MRKLLLIALSAVLTAAVGHAANDDIIVDGVVYEWYENSVAHQYGYIATGWDEKTPIQSLHIRGQVDGYQVFGIANGAFEDNEDIVYLTIDEGITSIGQNAFCRCSNIEVAILPEGLETIEEEAFAFCTSLTTMVIPSTVTEIQAHAFSGCTGVTDVYFLMTDVDQLRGFNWWDGIYHDAPQQAGGMEFNTNQNTVIHVPDGMLQDYVDSEKFVAWIPLVQDDNCYPLWWIVNYGAVGLEYTVSDDLAAVYVDVDGGLYAKDDNQWLTPDRAYPGEIDYMPTTGLMKEKDNKYDQSNWVVLTNVEEPDQFLGCLIAGRTITGTLVDKKNPVIEVSDEATLMPGAQYLYEKNVYIPASFMGRAQLSPNGRVYALVQPKSQELIRVDWTIYCEDDECFYLPEPDEDNGINTMELKGGFSVSYDLYEGEVPILEDCGYYAFDAINRRIVASDKRNREIDYTPYTDGDVSDMFVVFPLKLPDTPLPTGIATVDTSLTPFNDVWYSIDGRCLGTAKPTVPGFYINGNKKVLVTQ